MIDAFERQVARRGDWPALVGDSTLTYAQLAERSQLLAAAMLERRGNASEPVAIIAGNPIESVIGMLASLKAGRFYTPLDPTSPGPRLRQIVDLLRPGLLVADAETLTAARSLVDPEKCLTTTAVGAATAAWPRRLATDLSHVLFTSGSTAQPRGVMQQHRTFLRTVTDNVNALELLETDRFTIAVPLIWGHGLAMLFSSLLTGCTLFPFDIQRLGMAGLGQRLADSASTVLSATPSLLRTFVQSLPTQASFEHIRTVRLSGEATWKQDVPLFQRCFPNARIITTLGMSEAGLVTHFVIERGQASTEPLVPVGWPEASVEVEIDDSGELLVKHDTLSPGYWNDAASTAARFVPDPRAPHRRIYHTGDLARLREDGCLVHLGRLDAALKIRGMAVSLAEVQTALRALDDVTDAAVVGAADGQGTVHLVGFVVSTSRGREAAWMARLRDTVAAAQVPSAIVAVSELPHLAAGKVDMNELHRRAAELLKSDHYRQLRLKNEVYTPPRDPLEVQLVALWERILEVRPIGIDQDFFFLGGHSLLAARMLSEVERLCSVRLPLATLFSHTTIAQLAELLVASHRPAESITLLHESGTADAPLFFFHGDLNGGGFYTKSLLSGLGRTSYVVHPHGLDGGSLPPTVSAMAAERAGQIASLVHGPVHLAGYCNGGLVAYETARQLQASGHEVRSVVLIDTPARRRQGWLRRLAVATLRFALSLYHREWVSPASPQLAWKTLMVRLWRWTPFAMLRGQLTGKWQRHHGSLVRRNSDIGRAYRISPYAGRVVLLATRDLRAQAPFDASAGWSAVAPNLQVRRLPGNHLSVLGPHADELARQLHRVLED